MDKAAVKEFLVTRSHIDPEIAELMMRDGEGLELDGWTIETLGRGDAGTWGLVFTTPMLEWWGYGVTSRSRYEMKFNGKYLDGSYSWNVIALDRKPHWPAQTPNHPNLWPELPCMGRGNKSTHHPSLTQPNPFVAARSIASMLAGKVCDGYKAFNYGDEPTPICSYCEMPTRGDAVQYQNYPWHRSCYKAYYGKDPDTINPRTENEDGGDTEWASEQELQDVEIV